MIPLRVLVKLKGKTTNLGPHVQFIPQQPNFDQPQTQRTLPRSPLTTVFDDIPPEKYPENVSYLANKIRTL